MPAAPRPRRRQRRGRRRQGADDRRRRADRRVHLGRRRPGRRLRRHRRPNIWERNLLTGSTTLSALGDAAAEGHVRQRSPVISACGTAIAWDEQRRDVSSTPFFSPQLGDTSSTGSRARRRADQMVDTDLTGVHRAATSSPTVRASAWTAPWSTTRARAPTCTAPSITSSAVTGVRATDGARPGRAGAARSAPELISVNEAGTGSGNADAFLCPGNNPPHCGASSDPGVTVNADGTAITFFSESGDIAARASSRRRSGRGNVFVRYPDILGGGKTVDVTATAGGDECRRGLRATP